MRPIPLSDQFKLAFGFALDHVDPSTRKDALETLFNKPTNESSQLHISEYQKLKYLRFESSDIFPEGKPFLAYLLEFPKVFLTATSKEDYESVIKDVSQLGLPFFKRSFTFLVEPLFYVDLTKDINDFQAKTYLSFLTQSILLTNPDKELIDSIVINISKSFCNRKYTLKPNISYFLCFFKSILSLSKITFKVIQIFF